MEDSQVVTSFLNALYGQEATGWLEIRCLADNQKPVQRWYRPQDVPLDRLQAGNQAGRNIYFGVGLRRRRGGKKDDVLAIPALWLDLDGKDFAQGKPEALAALDRLPSDLPPSIALDSGHGFHAYWLLEPAVALRGNGQIEQVERILRGLAYHLGGDPSVADVARIMRLPGFLNVKDPTNPVPCTLLDMHPDRRFALAAFADFQGAAPGQAAVTVAETPGRPKLPAWTLDFLARGTRQGERNNCAFASACQLRDAGYPQAEALRAAPAATGGRGQRPERLPPPATRTPVRSAGPSGDHRSGRDPTCRRTTRSAQAWLWPVPHARRRAHPGPLEGDPGWLQPLPGAHRPLCAPRDRRDETPQAQR